MKNFLMYKIKIPMWAFLVVALFAGAVYYTPYFTHFQQKPLPIEEAPAPTDKAPLSTRQAPAPPPQSQVHYEIVDEVSGKTLMYVSIKKVDEGDELITEDGKWYVVVKVEGNRATARYFDKVKTQDGLPKGGNF
ncbi:hypothetical protein AXX12_13190 [Anaerosporomusa subterranea]|uniref:Uncharacterized protein n=1 Tax=Anaerosporomusa subterranea TaxID=1794912 RepID=A0A154BMB8_ANASB|nr:hypothetical protein [Anaerosporomusa subterranea]KYZ75127.1 hypothetical protein AXX12_13190 [Anaerosporomusa subterranea]